MILERAVEPTVPSKSLQVRFVIQDEKTIQFFFSDRLVYILHKREHEDNQEKYEEDIFQKIHFKSRK
jgi:hypothetical protein